MLTGTVPDDVLPELNTPLLTSGVNWIYRADFISVIAQQQ